DTERDGDALVIRRPAIPGHMISLAGSDITRGEVVLRPGARLGPRETGVLAAVGCGAVPVLRRPRVAILSTGDELVPPGAPRPPGKVHDCNQTVLADTCEELGAEALRLGIAPDDDDALARAIDDALRRHRCDLLLLSGGTSKGAGDRSYRALAALPGPTGERGAVIVHGVALKPGKPVCLAAARVDGRVAPIAALPGFPGSSLFTFHEFIAPVLRDMCGAPPRERARELVTAALARDVASERGRRQFVLVSLLRAPGSDALIALPVDRGSGSISAFCQADGFLAAPRQRERLDAGEAVEVELLAPDISPPDLLIVGSHCVGLERIADRLHAEGLRVRLVAQGSRAGLHAAAAGLCDVAPTHLYDLSSGTYNRPFTPDGCLLVDGYGRMQGLVTRPDDPRFEDADGEDPAAFRSPGARLVDDDVVMVNRNRGSGTRVLIDALLAGAPQRPRGYHHEARSHQGVATCVAQGRADWGVTIAGVAAAAGLRFAAIRRERFDFVIPRARLERASVRRFLELLADPTIRAELAALGFGP
ncbi:MAG: substrate-binding domain-containing protein, partial [Nannocystaceae bacterium]